MNATLRARIGNMTNHGSTDLQSYFDEDYLPLRDVAPLRIEVSGNIIEGEQKMFVPEVESSRWRTSRAKSEAETEIRHPFGRRETLRLASRKNSITPSLGANK
jgi:hypothetical protein